jgi:uncharacterized membrane protein (DUF4010 family)
MDTALFQQVGISLLLGLLVGLQREHAASGTAGMRTFPMITVLGTVSATLGKEFGGWVVLGGMLGVVAVLAFGYLLRLRQADPDVGNTTNAAVLLMYAVGALLTVEHALPVAVAVGGGVAVLLQFKPELHFVARTLGDDDLKAIMQFVLITCIILPVLPNRTYGPLEVFNPFKTWLMVVLIVGMSLGGYIVYKFLGRNAGIILGGILGGAISSTAATVSYSRRARGDAAAARSAAIVVVIASAVAFVRVLIEIGVVAPEFLRVAAAPIIVLMLLTAAPALLLWVLADRQRAQMPEQKNPTQLKSALVFGLMYAVVLFALAAGHRFLGEQGLYIVAGLSGLTDMDAVTLSTAQMARVDPGFAAAGWRSIVIAALANLLFKAGIAGVAGGWCVLRRIAVLLAIPLVGGTAILLLGWPW